MLILALVVLFCTIVVLQVNYNKNHFDDYNPDEYFTISTIHPKHEQSKTVYRALNGPRFFSYLFYPGAIIGMMNHMGGNVWVDGWDYPGHNYVINNYGLCDSCLRENMNDPNLRYFHYYLKLQAIIFMFLSFIPLIFYLWKKKFFITMIMIALLVGINILILKERSLFYIEPLLLSMINIIAWLYFYISDKKRVNLFWVILLAFLLALTASLKFSSVFLIVLIIGLVLSKFKKLEWIISYAILFVMFFSLFFIMINWSIFSDKVVFSNAVHDYFSNFWHYATGSNRIVLENYKINNLKNIINGLSLSLGGLIFLFPAILFYGIKYSSVKERINFAIFSIAIFLSILGIINQKYYLDRNIVPFIPSIILIAGFMIDVVVKKILNKDFFKEKKRVYGLYTVLFLIVFIPLLGNSRNDDSDTILPSAKHNVLNELSKIKDTKDRSIKVIDFDTELKKVNFKSIVQIKSIPETYRGNFNEVIKEYFEKFSVSDIVLISEIKNNKQLTNYLLPKIFDTNVQFSNHFIFYNKNYDPKSSTIKKKVKSIFKGSIKIREDLILEEVQVSNIGLGYRMFFRFNTLDLNFLQGCRFYFHGYPFEDEIQKLPANRIKHRFEGWDFTVTKKNIKAEGYMDYLVVDFKPSLKRYKKFNLAIFRGCTESEIITLENIKL